MRLSIAITHAPWIPDRVAARAAMRLEVPMDARFTEITDRGPIWYWSEAAWHWAAEAHGNFEESWGVFLQDDLELCPRYLEAVSAALEQAPGTIVGLETVHPAARTLARAGQRWCSTADGLIGRAYAIELRELTQFLEWRQGLRRGALETITEDTMIGVYALAKGRRIYHPLPALQRHRLELESAQGNERDGFRCASVLWTDGDVCGWTDENLVDQGFWRHSPPFGAEPEHLGRIWSATPFLGKRWDREWTDQVHARALADVCPDPHAKRFRLDGFTRSP